MSFFKVLHQSKKSKARMGEITTSHGVIKTPAFVPVGTKGTIKGLTPAQIKEIGVQVSFVNTYHLAAHPGTDIIEKAGGIHSFSKLEYPLMSDSGGFQVFSLGRRAGEPLIIKIHEDGVIFRSTYDGKVLEFTPEKSIQYQKQIGADLMMAFDEVTEYGSTYEYTKKAMGRTHKWLIRCISQVQSTKFKVQSSHEEKQHLYGIIQGGAFEDLRKEAAKFVTSQDVDGIAIGSIANSGESKEAVRKQMEVVVPFLPADKPVHFLGIGHVDDIWDAVGQGIDTFDCVEPTRLARMGMIYQVKSFEKTDINKMTYKSDLSPVDKSCTCYTCQNFTKAYLHHLFKQKELLAYTLASYHNLRVMEKFMEEIRKNIIQDRI